MKNPVFNKIIGRTFVHLTLLAIALIVGKFLLSDDKKSFPPIESKDAQFVEKLCESLPKPQEFFFAKKSEPFKYYKRISVDHIFHSKRPQQEIFPIFILWFNENSWIDNKDKVKPIQYSKDDLTVTISLDSLKSENYFTITCSKLVNEN